MDYSRQSKLLEPSEIKRKSISVIGVGATGSYLAMLMAQLGWGNTPFNQGVLKVFDGDVVEAHNLANQIYEPSHIGMPKVESLKSAILRKCNFEIESYNCMVTKETDPLCVQSTYVFLLTDTMSSRREIYESCLKYSINTDLIIETRMGLRDGRIYAFNPNNKSHVDEWLSTLYGDDVAETSLCGASSSIISTVMFLASLASQRVVQHFNENYGSDTLAKDSGKRSSVWNEVQFSLYPENFYLRRFGEEPIITSA
jgi:molybdopterin/thiamine biosynthesis adenylyltransferase